jgi:hypothetical protein
MPLRTTPVWLAITESELSFDVAKQLGIVDDEWLRLSK